MQEKIRYLLVGALNACFTCAIYVAGLYVFHMQYLVALSAAFLCGLVLTYFLNYVWVFKPQGRFTFRKRFIMYVWSNAATFSVNLLLLHFTVEYLRGDPFLSQMGLMVLLVAANFFIAKYWSLRPHP